MILKRVPDVKQIIQKLARVPPTCLYSDVAPLNSDLPVDVGIYQSLERDRRPCTVTSSPRSTPPDIHVQTSQTSQGPHLPVTQCT